MNVIDGGRRINHIARRRFLYSSLARLAVVIFEWLLTIKVIRLTCEYNPRDLRTAEKYAVRSLR